MPAILAVAAVFKTVGIKPAESVEQRVILVCIVFPAARVEAAG